MPRERFETLETAPQRQSGPRWFLTRHALLRMREMGVDRAPVVETLDDPETSWPSHQGRRVAVGNGLAVVFDPANHAVVTVLWHTHEEWSRETGDNQPISTRRAA